MKKFLGLPVGLALALAPAGLGVGELAVRTLGGVGGGQTRTYYVAADEVPWDYAPSGMNRITGQPFGPEENI